MFSLATLFSNALSYLLGLLPTAAAAAAAQMSEKMELSEKQAEEGLVDEAQALLAEVSLSVGPAKMSKGDLLVFFFFNCFSWSCFVFARGWMCRTFYLTSPYYRSVAHRTV